MSTEPEYKCVSVPGGWQTEIAGVRLGPIFNSTADLWKWQGLNFMVLDELRYMLPKLREDDDRDLYEVNVSFEIRARGKGEACDIAGRLADHCRQMDSRFEGYYIDLDADKLLEEE